MADQRITDLSSIGTLATGDLFVVTDQSQGDIAKNADIDIIASYVRSTVPSSARAFGGSVNEISTWAEGNSTEIIPSSKLPASSVPDLSNYVTLDTTQVITGIKNFTNLRSNSQEVVTIGNAQTVTGDKTFDGDNIYSGDNLHTGIETFNNTAGGIQANLITAVGNTDTFIDTNSPFINGMRIDTSGIRFIDMFSIAGVSNSFVLNGGSAAVDYTFSASSKSWLTYQDSSDTLTVNVDNLVGIAEKAEGSWTPTFTNGGTEGTISARYSKTGQTVTATCTAQIAASTSTFAFVLNTSSLPFASTNSFGTGNSSAGTFYTSSSQAIGFTAHTSGTIGIGNPNVFFVIADDYLRGDGLLGFLVFTITYITIE